MEVPVPGNLYRVAHIRPWASEGTDDVPESLNTFFAGKEVALDDLQALIASFGANFESGELRSGIYQVVVNWRGHRYDLDMEVVPT